MASVVKNRSSAPRTGEVAYATWQPESYPRVIIQTGINPVRGEHPVGCATEAKSPSEFVFPVTHKEDKVKGEPRWFETCTVTLLYNANHTGYAKIQFGHTQTHPYIQKGLVKCEPASIHLLITEEHEEIRQAIRLFKLRCEALKLKWGVDI